MSRPLALALLSLACLAAPSAEAAESFDSCTHFIGSLPAVLSSQGTWCMDRDLSTSMVGGSAIVVTANNVTIDCNHYKLGGLAAGAGTNAWGIQAEGRQNLTVRNCTIRGFGRGISIFGAGSAGHVIEDNRFDGNRRTAVFLYGTGSALRRNDIVDTGGATGDGTPFGLYVAGDASVVDNSVDGVIPFSGVTSGAYGIAVNSSVSSVVRNNRVTGLDGGDSQSYGIAVYAGTYASVVDNDISLGAGGTTDTSRGIYCANEATIVDNRIFGFDVGLDGCDDDGGNVVKP